MTVPPPGRLLAWIFSLRFNNPLRNGQAEAGTTDALRTLDAINLSKTGSRSSEGMPIPRSHTSIFTASPRRHNDINRCIWGEYLTALSRRFTSAWTKRAKSKG